MDGVNRKACLVRWIAAHVGPVLFALAMALPGAAHADKWMPATVKVVTSTDGAYRFTVAPGGAPVSYCRHSAYRRDGEAQVADTDTGECVEKPDAQRAQGLMEVRRRDGTWRQAWRKPLLNPIAPVWMLVTAKGGLVTFDEWAYVGYGPHVLVIYDRHGRLVKAHSLTDLVPKDFARVVPHTSSSRQWCSERRLSADGRHVELRLPPPDYDIGGSSGKDGPWLQVDLRTGRSAPMDPAGWDEVVARASAANAARIARETALEQEYSRPVLPPATANVGEWQNYAMMAWFRLPLVRRPSLFLLERGTAAEQRAASARLRALLVQPENAASVVLAAPGVPVGDIERVVRIATKGIPKDPKRVVFIIAVAEPATADRIRVAFASYAPIFRVIDPGVGIPGRPATPVD